MKKFILLFIICLLSTVESFASVKIGDLYYDLTESEAQVDCYVAPNPPVVVIPSSVSYDGKTYSVTSIGDYAFYGCTSLTSVEIPSSVTSIGDHAFWECIDLTSVEIPSSVTSIGDNAFYGCTSLTSVEIPSSVTSIGDHAFSGCSGLTNVVIPSSVTSIGQYAFSRCSGLTSISVDAGNTVYDSRNNCNAIIKKSDKELIAGCKNTVIPSSVTSIYEAFSGCSGLTSIEIPSSVTRIGIAAFSGCTSLTSVEIPSSVTSIGIYAFSGCSGLTSVVVPSSVTSISGDAFSGCSNLTSISVDAGNTVYDSRNNCNAIIEKSNNELIAGCKNTVIPSSVTSIGYAAFRGCSGLTSVEIPSSVTSIGSEAFFNCSGLTSVVIPSSVTSIDYAAFDGCSGLTSVEIPSSVTSIGYAAFRGCSGLTSIEIPTSVTSIGFYAFSGCSGLTSVVIPSSVTSIHFAFSGCSGLTSIVIPSSVTSIGDLAFSGCSGLTSVVIPSSVTSIKYGAFENCSKLKSLTFFGVPEEVDTYAIPAATIVYVPRDIYDAAVAKFTKNTVKLIPDTNVEEYDDILYVKEAELRRGATSSVLLKMKNSVDVTGFQFDMHLPTGMSLALDEFGDPMIELAGTRTNEKRHTVTWKKQSDDVWRVVCSSMSNQTFAGNDGEVLKIFLDVPANAEERNYDFIITNIELSHPDNTRHTISHAQYPVNVVSYTLGDVNDDGEITVSDVTGTVNLILNTNTDGLNRRAADINGDHDITITDAAGVVNMVLSAPVKSALRTPRYGSEGFLCVESSVAVPGHTFEVPIALSSTADEYAGMQFDLVLPAGLRLADANGDRRHQLAFAQQADGSERIASLSTSNATYSGNGTTVVTLILEADASFTGGDIRIESVELVRPDLSSTKPASAMAFIGVEGPTGITTAESAAKSSTVYDLQGRRATVSHGIGISGHRKSINK